MTNAPDSVSIPWHQLLGKLLELALTPLGIQIETEVQVTAEPPKVDVLLLRRETPRWTSRQRALLPDGIRESNAGHQLLEFKYSESIGEEALAQAVAYEYFYRTVRRLGRKDVQIWLISSKTPQRSRLQEWGYNETDLPGVYQSSHTLVNRVGVLVLNQLSDSVYNAFVKVFASRHSEKEIAFQQVDQIDDLRSVVKMFIRGLRTIVEVKEENDMTIVITPEYVMRRGEELTRVLLEMLTTEERLAGIGPKERLAGLRPEERLAGLRPEERVAGLRPEERVAGVEPEEVLKVFPLDEIEAYLQRQRSEAEENNKAAK